MRPRFSVKYWVFRIINIIKCLWLISSLIFGPLAISYVCIIPLFPLNYNCLLVFFSLLDWVSLLCFIHFYIFIMQHNVEDILVLDELIIYLVCPLFHTLLWVLQIQNWWDPTKACLQRAHNTEGHVWADGQLQKHCANPLLMFSYSVRVILATGGGGVSISSML